jgi:hypothetical protein
MKLRLLIAFMALTLSACSDDDQSSTGPKKLQQVNNISYNDNGTISHTGKLLFDNGRLSQIISYRPSGEQFSKSTFFYNDDNLLVESKLYTINTSVPYLTTSYIYDDQGRIIQFNETVEDNFEVSTSEKYVTYNSDDTISYWWDTSNGQNITYTYYLNDDGKIFKVMNPEGETMEVTYEGNDIVSVTEPGGTTTYSFDNSTEVKGDYLKIIRNQYNNDVNAVLAAGLLSSIGGIDRYQISSNGAIDTETVYEFDDEGYPVTKTIYYDGIDIPRHKAEIIYE